MVSDIAWARAAFLKGIKFTVRRRRSAKVRIGGLSSSAKYRELIKRENAELNKAIFLELSIGQAQEIYEFRFRAALALNVSTIVGSCSTALKDSLRKGFGFLLKCKAFILRAEAVDSTFIGLFELCTVLGIRHSRLGLPILLTPLILPAKRLKPSRKTMKDSLKRRDFCTMQRYLAGHQKPLSMT